MLLGFRDTGLRCMLGFQSCKLVTSNLKPKRPSTHKAKPTLLYSTKFSTLLYSTLRYSTLLYSLLYSTLLYSTLLYTTKFSILSLYPSLSPSYGESMPVTA